MSKVVTDYKTGVKYSFRSHGLRSRLLLAFAAFVVSFGGALALASPADAAPGDVSCFVEVTPTPTPSASVSPSPSPSVSPSPSLSPTPCPTVTVTVPGLVVTVTKNQTVYVQGAPEVTTITVAPLTSEVPSPTAAASPSPSTPQTIPAPVPASSGSGLTLAFLAWLLAAVCIAILLFFLILKIIQRRRNNVSYQGAHFADTDRTQMIQTVGEYGVDDYVPPARWNIGGPDHDGLTGQPLGGWAGENYPIGHDGYGPESDGVTVESPQSEESTSGDSDTRLIPPASE